MRLALASRRCTFVVCNARIRRYSVTPEPIGREIARRLGSAPRTIVDGFAGVGGNAIQFALAGHFVIAVEIDAERLVMARHNARVYGVEERIEFLVGDFMRLAKSLRADVVFLSPPWGGPEYSKVAKFSVKHGMRPDGHRIFDAARQITCNVVYYLPRNVDTDELAQLGSCSVFSEGIDVRGTLRQKAVTAYFSTLRSPSASLLLGRALLATYGWPAGSSGSQPQAEASASASVATDFCFSPAPPGQLG